MPSIGEHSLSQGVAFGIIAGLFLILAIILGIVFAVIWRRREKNVLTVGHDAKHLDIENELQLYWLDTFTLPKLLSITFKAPLSDGAEARKAARLIFRRKSLEILKLKYDGPFNEHFYKEMERNSTHSRIKNIIHIDGTLSSVATGCYVRALFQMPYLREWSLENAELSDDFYTEITKVSLCSRIESLDIQFHALSDSASRCLGDSICHMPCLKTVTLRGQLQNGFFFAMSDHGAPAKIESLDIQFRELSDSSLRCLGQSFCLMQCLKTVALRGELQNGFFFAMSEHGAPAKIESLDIQFRELSDSSLRFLGHSICRLPCLKTVALNGELQNEFFSAMSEHEAPAKVEKTILQGSHLHHKHLSMIAHLPMLRYLMLIKIASNQESQGKRYAESASDMNASRHPLTELVVDNNSLPGLCDMGLLRMWPCPKRVKIFFRTSYSSFNTLRRLALTGLTDLCLQSHWRVGNCSSLLSLLTGSFTRLLTFSLLDITPLDRSYHGSPWSYAGNDIIKTIRNHPQLKNVRIIRCDSLDNPFGKVDDALVREINKEGKMEITVEHGYPQDQDTPTFS